MAEHRQPSWPLATVAVAAATLAASVSFLRVFAGAGWVAPVVTTAVVLHLVAWGTRRAGLGGSSAGAVLAVALYLMAAWTVTPSALTYGLPLAPAAHAMADALRQARAAFPDSVSPVPTAPGFVLLAVLGAGGVAMLGDWAAFRVRSPLQSAAGPLILLTVCSVTGTSSHRALDLALVVATTSVSLLAQGACVSERPTLWLGGGSMRSWSPSLAGASLVGLVAVVASVVAVPGATTSDGHGLLGWRGDGPGGGGGSDRSVISPIVDLQTRLLDDGDTPVFTVTSSVPSYWRLTSLDTFTGVQWESTDTYHGVSKVLPGLQAAAAGSPTVAEHFHIQSLASIWMPTAFTPASIHGGGQVSWDPSSGSLLAAASTSDGLDYSMSSVRYLGSLTGASLAHLPGSDVDSGHSADLELPSSVPPSVYALADQITAGAPDEYAAALALQDYFVDNPIFSYSTDPPDHGYGTSALTDFLFRTHSGYCQQFAGAYAVLARAAGLPTRLAIGFTTGTPIGAGTYQVTDADAHTWPEVWFGPRVGWVPFEPTKGGGFAIPDATSYTGNTAGPQATVTAPPVTTPTTLPVAPTAGHVPAASPAAVATTVPVATAVRRRPSRSPVPVAIAAIALAGVAWLAVGAIARVLRRRQRHRRGASLPPDQRAAAEVLASWTDVTGALAVSGIARRQDETLAEFAARATPRLTDVVGPGPVAAQLAELAAITTEAAFRPGALDPALATRAARITADIGRALHAATGTAARIRRLADPRLVWRDA